MGLHLLNISVDSADPEPEHVPEDLSFNDQESIVEIVLEKILGYEDAIEEYDDHDTEDHHKKTKTQIDLITQYMADSDILQSSMPTQKQKFSSYITYISTGFCQLDTPPPKI